MDKPAAGIGNFENNHIGDYRDNKSGSSIEDNEDFASFSTDESSSSRPSLENSRHSLENQGVNTTDLQRLGSLDIHGNRNINNPNITSANKNQASGSDQGGSVGQSSTQNNTSVASNSGSGSRQVNAPTSEVPYDPADDLQRQKPPKFPQYKTAEQRKATYQRPEWPGRLNNKVAILIESGFFYTGTQDSVRCFQCSIGLRNWDPEDVPWVEHARWYPRCPYVIETKGQAYIDKVQEAAMRANMNDALQENNQRNNLGADANTVSRPETPPPPRSNDIGPTEYEKKNPLIHPAAQSVLEAGYLPKIVKKAVDRLLKVEGWSHMTGANLMKTIMDFEEHGEIDPMNCKIASRRPGPTSLEKRIQSYDRESVDIELLKKELAEMRERKNCQFCSEKRVCIVFLPCGHLVSCAQCAPAMKFCPICRTVVKATVRVNTDVRNAPNNQSVPA